MATNNAINTGKPIEIANGGTGASSMSTPYGVTYYDGTKLVTTSAGTNGQVIVASTGSAPQFATLTSSDSSILFTTGAGSLALSGKLVQYVISSSNATTTSSTVIPNDNTIPQNTEGVEFITATITPKSSSNILLIYGNINLKLTTGPGDGGSGLALFQDSTADALYAANMFLPTGTTVSMPIIYSKTAGTTSSTTFKIRVGPGSAANTITFNMGSFYGGVITSYLNIYELYA